MDCHASALEVTLQHLLTLPGADLHGTVACVSKSCNATAMASAPRLLVKLVQEDNSTWEDNSTCDGEHNGCIAAMHSLPSIHTRMPQATELCFTDSLPSCSTCKMDWSQSSQLAARMAAEYSSSMVAAGAVLSHVTKLTALCGRVPLPDLAQYAPNITHARIDGRYVVLVDKMVASLQDLRALSSLTISGKPRCMFSTSVRLNVLTNITHLCIGIRLPQNVCLPPATVVLEGEPGKHGHLLVPAAQLRPLARLRSMRRCMLQLEAHALAGTGRMLDALEVSCCLELVCSRRSLHPLDAPEAAAHAVTTGSLQLGTSDTTCDSAASRLGLLAAMVPSMTHLHAYCHYLSAWPCLGHALRMGAVKPAVVSVPPGCMYETAYWCVPVREQTLEYGWQD